MVVIKIRLAKFIQNINNLMSLTNELWFCQSFFYEIKRMPLYLGTWKSQTEYLNDIYNQIKYLPVLLLNIDLGDYQLDPKNRLITLLHCYIVPRWYSNLMNDIFAVYIKINSLYGFCLTFESRIFVGFNGSTSKHI